MCGLAGRWTSTRRTPGEPRVAEALVQMHRRGPDARSVVRVDIGDGELVLGHARLSIIDLSDDGVQPMWSTDRQFAIVFNGEIYNYLELREELKGLGHVFHTRTDTEVLLAAWREWGVACLTRFVGMFAFAIFDRASRRLTCVRDAFGIKPFFYEQTSTSFCFASDLLGMRAVLGRPLDVHWQRAWDYLAHGDYDSLPQSFCRDVFHLPPAHLLEVDLDTGSVAAPRRWWRPDPTLRTAGSFTDAADGFRHHFVDSVRLHMRSDVPLGAALSGGLDSSSIVCVMRHVAPEAELRTFSFIADDPALSEEHFVDRVNTTTSARGHAVRCGPTDLLRDLDDLVLTQGEPFGSTSIYAQYRVFQRAREAGVTVTLDGQGADELLAGYIGYPGARFRSLVETEGIPAAVSFMRGWTKWPGRRRRDGLMYIAAEYVDGDVYQGLRTLSGRSAVPAFLRRNAALARNLRISHPRYRDVFDDNTRGRRLVAAMSSALTHRGLPALLRHGDRNAMRFSVESRVPFLTTTMADFLLGLPEEYLLSSTGETKRLMRAALRGIVPDDLLDRRDKIGFQTPPRWLLDTGLQARLLHLLRDDEGVWPAGALFDRAMITATLDGLATSRRAPPPWLWRVLNFALWKERVIDAR
jgi:asparagine synthase (glutamine-hydrolysing)